MIYNSNLNTLCLEERVINFLNNRKIFLIKDLWVLSRNDLKEMGMKNRDISQISVKLQLNGIDLNKKVYAKS